MKELFKLKTNDYIFNHIIYDQKDDRIFAMHSHDLYEMIFITKGQVKYSIENQIYHAKKNDFIILRPFSYHFFHIEGTSDYEKVGILFSSNVMSMDLSFIKTSTKINTDENDIINGTFKKLIHYYNTFPQDIFEHLLLSCTTEIIYNLSLVQVSDCAIKYHSDLIEKALLFINENLFTIKNVSEISNHLFVSKNYFSNVFSKEMNISIKSYIREKRLLHARTMLLSGQKASTIYEKVGFDSYTGFYRAYTAYFKASPSDIISSNKIK